MCEIDCIEKKKTYLTEPGFELTKEDLIMFKTYALAS